MNLDITTIYNLINNKREQTNFKINTNTFVNIIYDNNENISNVYYVLKNGEEYKDENNISSIEFNTNGSYKKINYYFPNYAIVSKWIECYTRYKTY